MPRFALRGGDVLCCTDKCEKTLRIVVAVLRTSGNLVTELGLCEFRWVHDSAAHLLQVVTLLLSKVLHPSKTAAHAHAIATRRLPRDLAHTLGDLALGICAQTLNHVHDDRSVKLVALYYATFTASMKYC